MRSLNGERVLAVLLFAAAAAAAVLINVLLLGKTSAANEPVGQLSPRVHLPAAPHWAVRPTRPHPRDERADD